MFTFFRQTADAMRAKQLREAELELATAEWCAEYYAGCVETLRNRISRLQNHGHKEMMAYDLSARDLDARVRAMVTK